MTRTLDTTPALDQSNPHRMTLSKVLELLLARGSSDHSSVSLTRNAKGDTQIEVVVRASDGGEVTSATHAAREAVRLYDLLRQRYPLSDGRTAAAPTREVPI